MGLFDRIKAYLNEEPPEDAASKDAVRDEKPDKKARKPRRSRDIRKLKKVAMQSSLEVDSELANARAKNAKDNERKAVRDFCEQLIDVKGHIEEAKREYAVVTEYLTDIQRIEELPDEMGNSLTQIANNIERLDKNRQKYLQSENLLTMEQYNTMANYEDDIVDTIKKLNEMEMRDSLLKNDMGHLEGEKEDLRFMRSEYADGIDRLRTVLITVLIVFLLTIGTLLVVSVAMKKNFTLPALVLGFVAVLIFVVSYVRYVDLKNEARDSLAKINRAISLLNKVKVKYINNVNAIDYIYEKFDVNSCKELEFRWEQYNTMVRDAQKYYQTNSELREQNDRLMKKLAEYGIEDPLVWTNQVHAFIDRRELVEIKHGLVVRRQKLRERITTCQKLQENAMIALRASVEDNPGLVSLISEILTPYNIKVSI